MLMFSLLSPCSPSFHRSAVLPLSVIFSFSYPGPDGLTALAQQSESRLHSWSVSKLDSLLKQLKPQQWGGYRERATVCHGIICDSFLDTVLFPSHLIPDCFPDPSDSSPCFYPPIWNSGRTTTTTSLLQLLFSFVTLATQSCHQLAVQYQFAIYYIIETMLSTSFSL